MKGNKLYLDVDLEQLTREHPVEKVLGEFAHFWKSPNAMMWFGLFYRYRNTPYEYWEIYGYLSTLTMYAAQQNRWVGVHMPRWSSFDQSSLEEASRSRIYNAHYLGLAIAQREGVLRIDNSKDGAYVIPCRRFPKLVEKAVAWFGPMDDKLREIFGLPIPTSQQNE